MRPDIDYSGSQDEKPMEQEWFRSALIAFLEELGSERKLARIDDMIRVWTNHLYVPTVPWSSYLPAVHSEALQRFQRCFSDEELNALSTFHERFVSIAAATDIDRRRELAHSARAALDDIDY